MWPIIQNEWLSLSRHRVLLGLSVGFLGLLFLTIYLGNLQSKEETKQYIKAKDHLREQWERIDSMNPHGAAHYGTYVFKPSTLLSSLDDGVNNITGKVLRVEGHVQNEIVYSEASQNKTISKFGKLKSALLLQYIIPLFLLFLAFQSIHGEKLSGRLKLLLLQGTKPSKLLFAKTLAVSLYGIGLLLLTILASSALNYESITGDIIDRAALLLLVYSLYYFILTALTIYLSARLTNANLALTTMLGAWIFWTIFLPNILMSSVESWHQLPSRERFKAAMKEDRSQGLDGHNPADERAQKLEETILKEYGVDSLSQLPINFDGIVMQEDEEYGNQVWDKHFGNLRMIFEQQKRSYQLGGLVNPFIALRNASMGFAGSDNLHHQEFLVQVENYRRVFIKRLNDEHAFGGSKTGDWDWEADNAFYKSVNDFDYRPTAISSVLGSYLFDLIILAGWATLAIVLLFLAAQKMRIL
ncbi:MAG: DUF3526 domain-containing protein [Bacteroidota bacterium]